MESADYSPIQSPQYEELLEVVTRAVAKLDIDWPADDQTEKEKSKLDFCVVSFLRSKSLPLRRSLPFFPDLHTEVSRSWKKPFSSRLFIPASDYYGNVAGLSECGYRAMPRVKQTLAGYLSPGAASSLKAPVLPTKPLHVSSVLVGKGYTAAGQAGACLHTMAVLQAYQADLLKELDDLSLWLSTKAVAFSLLSYPLPPLLCFSSRLLSTLRDSLRTALQTKKLWI